MKEREIDRQNRQWLFQEQAGSWARWAAILLLAVYLLIHPEISFSRAVPYLAVVVAALLANVGLWLAPPPLLQSIRARKLSLWFDLFLNTALILLSGGRQSNFFYLYLLTIFWAALSYGRAAAGQMAGAALLSYITALVLAGQWVWDSVGLFDLLMKAVVLALTAYWGGIISDHQHQLLNRHRELTRLAEDWSRTASDIQSAAMYGLGALLSSSRSIEETLNLTLDAVEDILKADRCSILLLDKASNELVLRAARGMRAGAVGKLRLRSDQGLAGEALRTGKPVNVPDTDLEPLFVPSPSGYEKIRSMLVVPLLVRDNRLGVINISSVKKKRVFTSKEMMAIGLVADYAALALENAGLLEEKERQAITDGLTGLYNYRYFKNRLSELVERYQGRPARISLIWMDLDHFKEYNDTFGHIKGSEVLKRLAGIISDCVKGREAVVTRYGGDEFAVILPGMGGREAGRIAEEIRKAIYRTDFAPGGRGYQRISASIGLAVFPDDARDANALVEKADQAMYYAKERGRNKVACWRKNNIELRRKT